MSSQTPEESDSRTFVFADPDEAASKMSNAQGEVRIYPGNSAGFNLTASGAEVLGIGFVEADTVSGFEFEHATGVDGYILRFITSGGFELKLRSGQNSQSQFGSGMVTDCLPVVRCRLLPATAWRNIWIGSNDLHARLQALIEGPVIRRVQFVPHISLDSSAIRTLQAIAEVFKSSVVADSILGSSPAALTSLREAMLNIFLEGIPHNYSLLLSENCHFPSPGNVKRAIEFIRTHADSPVRLEDIANASGTSPRALQLAFQRFKGMSPMQYLSRTRLIGARQELMSGVQGNLVSLIALKWGFPHAGLFATSYKRAFGESPSSTLRRAGN